MKNLTLFISFFTTINFFAQTANWNKDDRNNLYSDCMSYSTKYKNINNEQKESICLCYLDEITKKYVKNEFEAKIDIETKRIKEAMLSQCAKNIGVDLTMQQNEEVVKEEKKSETVKGYISKTILSGKWKTDDLSIIEFKSDGTYNEKRGIKELTLNKGYIVDNVLRGNWFLDEKGNLTIRKEWSEDIGIFQTKIRNYTGSYVYRFDSYTNDYLKFTCDNNGTTIQANRLTQ
jgi:hypothetical protein